jgi:hypothetical protein
MDLPTGTIHTAAESPLVALLREALRPDKVGVFVLDDAVTRRVAFSIGTALEAHRIHVLLFPGIAPGACRDDALWHLLAFADGLGGSAAALADEVKALLPGHDAAILAAVAAA